MPVAPDPDGIYERAAAEGRRRLGMTPVRQMTTGFIAGVTIVFGIVALGVTEALVEPTLGRGVATIVGALAFAIGIVFLIVGRTELFTENYAARAVLAGALITLLSYMLEAVDTVTARILVAYLVGFFLALGPFDHVVVSALHVIFGIWLSDAVTYSDLAVNIGLSTVGNLVGGLLLVTLTHTAQVKGG